MVYRNAARYAVDGWEPHDSTVSFRSVVPFGLYLDAAKSPDSCFEHGVGDWLTSPHGDVFTGRKHSWMEGCHAMFCRACLVICTKYSCSQCGRTENSTTFEAVSSNGRSYKEEKQLGLWTSSKESCTENRNISSEDHFHNE